MKKLERQNKGEFLSNSKMSMDQAGGFNTLCSVPVLLATRDGANLIERNAMSNWLKDKTYLKDEHIEGYAHTEYLYSSGWTPRHLLCCMRRACHSEMGSMVI